jgi:hypothetical protein
MQLQTVQAQQPLTTLFNTINICTVYRDVITPHMIFNLNILEDHGYNVKPHWIGDMRFRKGSKYDHYNADIEQCAARNLYLDEVPAGEFFLILDDDELLLGALNMIRDIAKLMYDKNRHTAFIQEILPDGTHKPRPRLLRKQEGMQYYWKHDMILVTSEVPDRYLRSPWELLEEPELNKCYNYIYMERGNSIYTKFIHLGHTKDALEVHIK